MYKKVSLTGIIITEPKAVKKKNIEETLPNILPEYYRVIVDKKLHVKRNNGTCWFCKQLLIRNDIKFIETLYGEYIGFFCSRICRDSFANMIKSLVALREEPKIALLPLEMYEHPEDIISMIKTLRGEEGVYGKCIMESERIQITLRSYIIK